MQTTGFIYHIITPEAWERALLEEQYRPSSLKTEGFIHFSTEDQVLESARIHLGMHSELVVLRVVLKHIKHNVKWEEGREGMLFPHLYGKLPLESVENTKSIFRQEDGSFEWE